jgi:S-adenosyl-L-methionine hydrolase (adenosine-forming)
MAPPVIALLTDFGLRDHYVGTMKAVALGVCPSVTFVDITHGVPSHDIITAALELAACYRYFPAGTIFLVVVDPGVGSARKAIGVEAGGFRFVAPDNGVLSVVFDELPPRRVVELTERKYARSEISRTFEGRDRFAPAAGWLASGLDLAELGPPTGPIHRLDLPKPVVTADGMAAQVLRVDRFGNLVTNIDRRLLETFAVGSPITIRIAARGIAKVVETYADVPAGELCAVVGSSEQLEIAVNGGSAAKELGAGRGAAVHVRRRA